jgi:Glycosyl hydrolase family 20, catalytic domain
VALNKRCLHVDLKGMTPKFEYLQKIIRKLADLEINSILLEYEDKIQYDSHPVIAHPTLAYSKEQVRELVALCASLGISIIPKLQCYGHWDYILKHPEYHDLRGGNGESSYQICPSIERSFDIWQEMADELLELHPDAEYFHIGADEVNLTLPCTECNSQDRFKIYVNHIEKTVDYLRSKGKKVLIWDDVFRKYDIEKCNNLLRKVIPVIWQYRDINEEFIARLARYDVEIWASSGIQITDLQHPNLSPVKNRIKNLDDWALLIKKYGIKAHIATAWTRAQCQTPPEHFLPGSFYLIAYFAQISLNGKDFNHAEFDHYFTENFFGTDAKELTEAVHCFSTYPEEAAIKLKKVINKVKKNSDVLEIWNVLNKLDCVMDYVDYCFKANQTLYPNYINGNSTNKIKKNYLDGVRIVRERIDKISLELFTVLEKYMEREMIQEMIDTRFMAVQQFNDQWENIINKADTI